jgi:phenylalanyl-tRNA synthetase beta chain
MKISQKWLADFLQMEPVAWPPERVAEVLTYLGLEVEHIEDQAKVFDRFVVGQVTSCEPHPKADKLTVCTVDVGEGADRTIVCGAPNVAAGQVVVVALDGARIPGTEIVIGRRKLRGVESNGMICSAAELGISEDHSGILVLAQAEGQGPKAEERGIRHEAPGTSVPSALNLNDVIYDIAITPNRADCTSHIGIARDLQAYLTVTKDTHWSAPSQKSRQEISTDASLKVTAEVKDAALCPRYALQRISGVTVGPSPEWMQQRLRAVGLRPRNVIVDVTNYVNMELGQPLHAFDHGKLRGGGIVVRTAKNGEVFVTLDGKQRTLTSSMLMINDLEGPVAIAGVMGGQNSEIDDSTTDIVLESAFFDPSNIRRTAKALGLNTDASYRFERGVDIGNVVGALQRATQLILELAGGECGEIVDVFDETQGPRSKAQFVRFKSMRSINGIDVENQWMVGVFEALGCVVSNVTDDACEVTPPTWRLDLNDEIDYAEEVMRMYGINRVPASDKAVLNLDALALPPQVQAGGGPEKMAYRSKVRERLKARGYADCVTAVLTSPDLSALREASVVELHNALGLEFSTLRTSILPGLLAAVSRNLRHGAETVRLCEIGTVYHRQTNNEHEGTARSTGSANDDHFGIVQQETLAVVIAGADDAHWSTADRLMDLYDLLGDLAVLGTVETRPAKPTGRLFTSDTVDITTNGLSIGLAGQIQPSLASAFDIDGPVFGAELLIRNVFTPISPYRTISVFPSVRRDLALIVEEQVHAQLLIDVVKGASAENLRDVHVFDVYRDKEHVGVGKKSIALTLTFRSDERTLVDAEVEASIQAIIRATAEKVGAQIRGSSVQQRA